MKLLKKAAQFGAFPIDPIAWHIVRESSCCILVKNSCWNWPFCKLYSVQMPFWMWPWSSFLLVMSFTNITTIFKV